MEAKIRSLEITCKMIDSSYQPNDHATDQLNQVSGLILPDSS